MIQAPRTNAKLDAIREKRAQERAERELGRIAMLSWMLPLIAVAVAFATVEGFHRHVQIIGILNILVVLYSSTCSIRTWVNYARVRRVGLLVAAISGTLINLTLLIGLGWMVSLLIIRFGFS